MIHIIATMSRNIFNGRPNSNFSQDSHNSNPSTWRTNNKNMNSYTKPKSFTNKYVPPGRFPSR